MIYRCIWRRGAAPEGPAGVPLRERWVPLILIQTELKELNHDL